LVAAGCAAVGLGPNTLAPLEPTSIQTVEYYPFQVKGYQNSFPNRTLIVLLPVDARTMTGPNSEPLNGDPAVGIVTDQTEQVIQRLYAEPLPRVVQGAIRRSAEEAGLGATTKDQSNYAPEGRMADYVMATRITRCWVKKHRGPDGRFGPTWSTAADFALEVIVYKPPFKVPFWQGTSSSTYYDPPIGSFGLGPEDEAGIYDDPGQVLSVALTRAVAGIFQREDLRSLVQEDHISASR
jgi:hypothetical protein